MADNGNPHHGEDDDHLLLEELLDNQSPFLLMPTAAAPSQQHPHPEEEDDALFHRLVSSAVYSGPTLGDIESALSTGFRRGDAPEPLLGCCSRPPMSPSGKTENKYTLRIKSCPNGMADDGYKWRKYGQKSIKNSPNPRSYYRCTNPRCNAKKQVEKSAEDPDVFVVTYEGLHLHYAYSHFFLSRPPPPPPDPPAPMTPPWTSKKPKLQLPDMASPPVVEQHPTGGDVIPQGGLLEDIVPLLIRNPTNDISNFLEDLCFSSRPTSPPPSSSSSSMTAFHHPLILNAFLG